MRTLVKVGSMALLLLLSTACPGSQQSDAPKPDDPSTGTQGIDTVPARPPAPGTATGNGAPINNDDSVNNRTPSDNTQKQGAGAHPGAASATTTR